MEWLAVSGKWHSYRRDAARHLDSYHITILQPLQIATVIGTEHVRRGERISERRGIMRAQHTLETERKKEREEREGVDRWNDKESEKTTQQSQCQLCYKD